MQLYFSPGSCSLSPHILLHEIKAQFDLDQVDLANKTTQDGADYRTICRKGYVPALKLDNGEILTEGVAILQYLADTHPEAGLAPANGTVERAKLQGMLNFISSELHKSFAPLFSETASADMQSLAKEKIAKCFDYIEARFSDGRHYIMGNEFSIADIYLFVVTNWSNFKAIDLTPWPKLKAFMAQMVARKSVKDALHAEGLA